VKCNVYVYYQIFQAGLHLTMTGTPVTCNNLITKETLLSVTVVTALFSYDGDTGLSDGLSNF
jgi:hypothetical protein